MEPVSSLWKPRATEALPAASWMGLLQRTPHLKYPKPSSVSCNLRGDRPTTFLLGTVFLDSGPFPTGSAGVWGFAVISLIFFVFFAEGTPIRGKTPPAHSLTHSPNTSLHTDPVSLPCAQYRSVLLLCFLVLLHLWIFLFFIPVFILSMVLMSFFVCWVHLVVLILLF